MNLSGLERREDSGKIYLEGYFARFNEPYKVCEGWVETIAPGAFGRFLSENGDVKALWNHNHDLVLGSRANGTLQLEERADGLYGRVEINRDDRAAMDAYARIARGDVSGCSFGFDCRMDDFTDENGVYRTVIREVHPLYEVSPCVFPAYESTSIQAREKLDAMKQAKAMERSQWKASMKNKLRKDSK